MRRGALVGAFMALAVTATVRAQEASPAALTAAQQLGERLFGQDCGVCHTPPTIVSRVYGPILNKSLVEGHEAAIRDFIAHGSARMPGFQYYYTPAQIEAIVQYLDTVPGSAATEPAAAKSTGTSP